MEDKLVEFIARNLVDDADKVRVRRKETNHSVVVYLNVAPGDMGRVIGKGGRVATAIRGLLRAASRTDKRVILEID